MRDFPRRKEPDADKCLNLQGHNADCGRENHAEDREGPDMRETCLDVILHVHFRKTGAEQRGGYHEADDGDEPQYADDKAAHGNVSFCFLGNRFACRHGSCHVMSYRFPARISLQELKLSQSTYTSGFFLTKETTVSMNCKFRNKSIIFNTSVQTHIKDLSMLIF